MKKLMVGFLISIFFVNYNQCITDAIKDVKQKLEKHEREINQLKRDLNHLNRKHIK